jgi:hypothetical protein
MSDQTRAWFRSMLPSSPKDQHERGFGDVEREPSGRFSAPSITGAINKQNAPWNAHEEAA